MSFPEFQNELVDQIKLALFQSGILSADNEIPSIVLEDSTRAQHGELSTPVALSLSKLLKKNPLEIAQLLADTLKEHLKNSSLKHKITKIEVASPGFINFFLSPKIILATLTDIHKNKTGYGSSCQGKGKKVLIEFTSANPTGPLSVAHGRQAAVGDSLRRIMEFCGYKVTTEYYLNDEGNQINILGESIKARYLELLGTEVAFPENGYVGGYIKDLAQALIAKHGDKLKNHKPGFFADYGISEILTSIKQDLKDFDVRFDNWFSQKEHCTIAVINKAIAQLEKLGFIYDKDEAKWFASSELGDDKNRVLVKSDGSFTYLAPDIAYHCNKKERGFNQVIDIWGPDHHGYINRLKAAWQALGFNRDELAILIIQLATLFRQGKPVRMSTRAGEFISLKEVIDEVGTDAGRFFFLMRKADSHLKFDLEVAKSQSLENPVYYIQYAHARISSIIRNRAAKCRFINFTRLNLELLKEPDELNIIKQLTRFQDVVSSCAEKLEPFWLLNYLQELAKLFHNYYDNHRVLSTDNLPLSRARLSLIEAIKIVLAIGLGLLGVSQPEKM